MTAPAILVVEDESITARDIELSLRKSGYLVPATAFSGREAIAEARRCRPDLVLMDISLRGDMDGVEAACHIRKELQTPIIFLTAYADGGTLERAKAAEPFAYLLKPFEEAILATSIEIALNKHRTHDLVVRQAAEELHLSREKYKALAESVAEYAVVLLDATGAIVSWSPGAERAHGWHPGEVLGRNFAMLYPDREVERGKPGKDLQAAARAGRHSEYGMQAGKDNGSLAAQTTLIALRSSDETLAGFLRVSRQVPPGAQGN